MMAGPRAGIWHVPQAWHLIAHGDSNDEDVMLGSCATGLKMPCAISCSVTVYLCAADSADLKDQRSDGRPAAKSEHHIHSKPAIERFSKRERKMSSKLNGYSVNMH